MRSFDKKDSPTPSQIRKMRKARGMSQTAAAADIGVTLRTWQNWEAGKHAMHPIFWDVFSSEA